METECKIKKTDSNLIALKQATKKLEFEDLIKPQVDSQFKELILPTGTSYMVGLFKTPMVAIARVFSSGGSEFHPHSHDEWELILVLSGEIRLNVEGSIKTLKERDFFYLNPGQVHSAYYPVDSWVLCVTMPASESFPAGG